VTLTEQRVYLDHNASCPLRPESRRAMLEVLEGDFGNPSSIHAEGRRARGALENARRRVAALVGCGDGELVFTSGGSESISAAVRGVCDRAPESMRRLVIPDTEHSAVLDAVGHARRRGFVVVTVPCDQDGRIDVDRYVMHLGEDVALAVLQWANSETGVIQPVSEIGRECRSRGVPFLVDAVQVAGKIEINPKSCSADMLAIASHKLGGPAGAGALMVRRGIRLAPLIGGGAQEKRRRGGTPGLAAIAGFAAAADVAQREMQDEARRLLVLRARVERRIQDLDPSVTIHGHSVARLPNTVNFSLPGVPGEHLVIGLDMAGFACSTGSACASGGVEPSHVLRAMGFDDEHSRGAVRVSLGWNTTESQIDRFLDALPDVVERIREGLREQV